MKKQTARIQFIEGEEIKALRLFLILFYIFLIVYDVFYYYIYPYINPDKQFGFSKDGLSYWYYIIFLLLLPLAFYLVKIGRTSAVKYLYLFGFIIIDGLNSFLIYYGTSSGFAIGNVVELVFIIFSPLFINKRFFWFSFLGIVFKYAFFGVILHTGSVVVPIFLFSAFSVLSFMLLNRFYSNLIVRTQMNDELRHTEKLAAVGQFATSISHEVRNPLASLKGFTQLQHEKHPEDSEYYSIMINEIERISSLLDDLLVIGKPKGMKFESHNIPEIIEYVTKVMENDAINQNIAFSVKMENNLPPIECDGKHLKQVLINLIKNGMEAMPEGGEISIKAELERSDMVLLSVRDEGQGIAEKDLEQLGTPFHTTKSDGTGLGLMVSFKIIEEHNGTILYDSVEGKGTTASIKLPVTQRVL
jgi:signal transduction histidine kinase